MQDLKLTLQMFYVEGHTFNVLVRPEGFSQCVLVRNSRCKSDFCLFTRKLLRYRAISGRQLA